ncbi:hypothetical protein BBJ28_00021286 [Nothophytophthora sp. Chile5]|nr:hypothetical protein BBJ28_00021286 [Nothophytophthora sp. Chile5]
MRPSNQRRTSDKLTLYSNLDQICVETLLRVMERLTQIVERYIAAEMPERFGLILDGWSHASEHFLAVFACYEAGGKIKTLLLCMAPLQNDEDDDLSARGCDEAVTFFGFAQIKR